MKMNKSFIVFCLLVGLLVSVSGISFVDVNYVL